MKINGRGQLSSSVVGIKVLCHQNKIEYIGSLAYEE